ncbi:MAG: VWA domain-containing protein [Anaerolineales bacterium]|nr:VWA domain-containing protein [Anaerolineales bacterium]
MNTRKTFPIIVIGFMILLVGACASPTATPVEPAFTLPPTYTSTPFPTDPLLEITPEPTSPTDEISGADGWLDWVPANGWESYEYSGEIATGEEERSGGVVEDLLDAVTEGLGLGGTAKEESADMAAPAEEMDGGYTMEEPSMTFSDDEDSGMTNQLPAELRAGSQDDNQQWDDYLLYRMNFLDMGIQANDIDVTENQHIIVMDGNGNPVLGATVTVFSGEEEIVSMITHADGSVRFYPKSFPNPEIQEFTVIAEKDEITNEIIIDREPPREHEITLNTGHQADPINLDILFLIDTTGSMGDEIAQLKENMILVSQQIAEMNPAPNVRFAMTVYRDLGDAFVARTFDFTPDVDIFIKALQDVQANGGGDYPEHLNQGLNNAINKPEWRIENTVSLVFLIADAPPQLNYNDGYNYAEDVMIANERGIKIYPIASSGLDDQGEFVLRQLAQITSGKFLFLTYGAGGDPSTGTGDTTTHHVDDFSVLSLDQMVVKIVEEELANLSDIH